MRCDIAHAMILPTALCALRILLTAIFCDFEILCTTILRPTILRAVMLRSEILHTTILCIAILRAYILHAVL